MPTALALLAFLLLTAPVAADERTFGTTSLVSHTIHASAFIPLRAADVAEMDVHESGDRTCPQSICFFHAPVFLPAGALVTSLELEGCDTSGGAEVGASMIQVGKLNDAATTLYSTFTSGIPGCGLVRDSGQQVTINNANNSYFVRMQVRSATRFRAVRIFFHLQVAAPATQIFDDVPQTHPFYRFIQALASSRITGGCSTTPPLFCPDAVVTREQMAAFLARALGLHWAP